MASTADGQAKSTKRGANSYSSDEWKQHRAAITRMYKEEGRTLKEVREHLEKEFDFTPSERMYKSRLHSWGLDKKKKEHEMLEIVRMGMQQGGNKDAAYVIRGRTITLADALHYFNRKGVKDPTILLEQQTDGLDPHAELSSPEDADVKTPLSAGADLVESRSRGDSDYDFHGSPPRSAALPKPATSVQLFFKPTDFAEHRLVALQTALGVPELRPLPAFRTISVEKAVQLTPLTRDEAWCTNNINIQLQQHYRDIFASRGISVTNAWTATSDDTAADRFYFHIYQGYSHLWNGQGDQADELFSAAADMIGGLVQENHVAFLIIVLDLVVRYDGSAHERPLLEILQQIADKARAVYQSESTPIFLIAMYLKECSSSRATVAEASMRKLLDFFQDSIGYFHQETIALLQMFATALLNRRHYGESAVRFMQLVDAFETTQSKYCYEVCYALRSLSEVFFHQNKYLESVQALKTALERSEGLESMESREIYVRCLRAMAEIENKMGRKQEAIDIMHYVVDHTRDWWGPDHTFTHRAKMHLKTIEKGESEEVSSIPPSVYRLGRGGRAANHVWVTRTSPTRLEA